MRTEENKRKAVEEHEGCMVKKTVKYTKTVQKAEAKREGVQEIVEVAEVVVNVEESEWRAEEEAQVEGEGDDLDPEQVRKGREEEMNYMVRTLEMFEFGSLEEAMAKAGEVPTSTKRIDRVKNNKDGREFVSCRLGARDC